MSAMTVTWKKTVEKHDFKAAFAYLSLLLDAERAELAVQALKAAGQTVRRANDILRACGYEPASKTDPQVKADIKTIRHGKPLAPILMVSFEHGGDIADGYHRVSAIYHLDREQPVRLRLAHIPELETGS